MWPSFRAFYLLLLALFSGISVGLAQSGPVLDSLQRVLATAENEDRVDALVGLTELYNNYAAYDSAVHYLEQAQALAEALEYDLGLARVHSKWGSVLWQRDNDYPGALKAMQQSEAFQLASGDTTDIFKIRASMGTINMLMGRFEEGLLAYQQGLRSALAARDTIKAIGVLNNISNVHLYTGDKEKRVSYLEQASDLLQKYTGSVSDEVRVNVLINLGDSYLEVREFSKGDSVLQVATQAIGEAKRELYLGRVYTSLLKLESLRKGYDKMIEYANIILGLDQRQGYNVYVTIAAHAYRANAYCETGRMQAARRDIDAFKQFIPGVNLTDRGQLLETASELYQCVGQADSALVYYQQFIAHRDTINSQQKEQRILELEALYEKEQQDNEINALRIQNLEQDNQLQRQSRYLLLAIAIGLVLAGLIYFFQQRRKMRILNEVNQMEQKLLSLQMNPHFIFNSIGSIQNFLYDKEDLPTAIRYLSQFAALMRQILEHSREKFISLGDEISTLRNYLDLQKLRFENTFDYEIVIDPGIKTEEIAVPPLIAQPFVENAIEHGMIYKIKDGKVGVYVHRKDDRIQLEIRDNGMGLSSMQVPTQNVESNKKSLATTITRERLHILSTISKRKFKLQVKGNETEGTTVAIDLPAIAI